MIITELDTKKFIDSMSLDLEKIEKSLLVNFLLIILLHLHGSVGFEDNDCESFGWRACATDREACYYQEQHCDNIFDCEDGSDEMNCDETTTELVRSIETTPAITETTKLITIITTTTNRPESSTVIDTDVPNSIVTTTSIIEPASITTNMLETTTITTMKPKSMATTTNKLEPVSFATSMLEQSIITTRKLESTFVTTNELDPTIVTTNKPESTLITSKNLETTTIATTKPESTLITSKNPETTTIATTKPESTLITSKNPETTTIAITKPESTLITSNNPKTTTITTNFPPITILTGNHELTTFIPDQPETSTIKKADRSTIEKENGGMSTIPQTALKSDKRYFKSMMATTASTTLTKRKIRTTTKLMKARKGKSKTSIASVLKLPKVLDTNHNKQVPVASSKVFNYEDCHPFGTFSMTYIDRRRICNCKRYVEGDTCNKCVAGTFYLDEKNQDGCSKCFCMNTNSTCIPSTMTRKRIVVKNVHLPRLNLIEKKRRKMATKKTSSKKMVKNEVQYFKLPDHLAGDRITSYGGILQLRIKNLLKGTTAVLKLKGNGLVLQQRRKNAGRKLLSFKFAEQYWKTRITSKISRNSTREDILTVLANVEAILVKASLQSNQTDLIVKFLSMDYAIHDSKSVMVTPEIEYCRCPEGYKGSSCERCAAGYEKVNQGFTDAGFQYKCRKKDYIVILTFNNTEDFYKSSYVVP